MAHERYNTEWIEEQGGGLVVRSFSSGIFSAVRELLAPENYARFRKRAAGMRNSAVYEIPELLERILADSRADSRVRTAGEEPSGSFVESSAATAGFARSALSATSRMSVSPSDLPCSTPDPMTRNVAITSFRSGK